MTNLKRGVAERLPHSDTAPNEPEEPAVITALHKKDREITDERTGAVIIGKSGYRRIDGLRWLLDHKSIGEHQYQAGRRLQSDWQQSKIEVCPRSLGSGGGGNPRSTLPDSKLDAGARYGEAMAVLPQSLVTLITLFLLPEDHPMALERCAQMVRRDRKAASFGIQIGLDLLARHYGFST